MGGEAYREGGECGDLVGVLHVEALPTRLQVQHHTHTAWAHTQQTGAHTHTATLVPVQGASVVTEADNHHLILRTPHGHTWTEQPYACLYSFFKPVPAG